MLYPIMLKVLVLVFSLASLGLAGYLERPSDVVYQRGVDTQAVLPCRVTSNETRPILWNKGGSAIYLSSQAAASNKYSVPKTQANNYTLVIRQLNEDDDDDYTCQIFTDRSSAQAHVTVGDEPSSASIVGPVMDIVENVTIDFKCNSDGGHPAPSFTWTLGGSTIDEAMYQAANVRFGVSTSTLRLIMSRDHDGKTLICRAENVLGAKTSQTISLDVKYSPRVSVTPTSQAIIRGDSVALDCTVDAKPETQGVIWRRDGVDINHEGLNLVVDVHQDTEYVCEASNVYGRGQASSSLIVNWVPSVTIAPDRPEIREDQALSLECTADAKPAAAVSWYKETEKISDGAMYSISSTSRNDAGRYTCRASNTINGMTRSAEATVTVNVLYAPNKPTLTASPSGPELSAGSRVVLTCSVPDNGKGNPQGAVHWHKNGRLVSSNLDELIIASSNVMDTGDYQCSVNNSVGEQQSGVYRLEIRDKPELVSKNPQAESLRYDSDTEPVMQCKFKGLPEPLIQWKFGGYDVSARYFTVTNEKDEDSSPFITTTSSLQFIGFERRGLSVQDFGRLTCHGENSQGQSDQIGSFDISVNLRPEIIRPVKFTGEDNSEARVTCLITSYPAVDSIIFKRSGNILSTGDRVMLGNLENAVNGLTFHQQRTLTITGFTSGDSGVYECEVQRGETVKSRNLLLQAPSQPDSPSELHATDIDFQSFRLHWTPGYDGGRRQTFRIQADNREFSTSSQDNWLSLEGFQPSKRILVTMIAFNQLGESAPVRLNVTTQPFSIPQPRVNLNSDSTVEVTAEINATQYCIKLYGSKDNVQFEPITQRCELFSDEKLSIPISQHNYNCLSAQMCLIDYPHICSDSVKIEVPPNSWKWIVIGVVLGVILIIIVVVVVSVVMVKRKRKSEFKKPSAPTEGYHNPTITGVEGGNMYDDEIVAYATHNDLSGGDCSDRNSTHACSPKPDNVNSQNVDSIYASVQKISTANKLRSNYYMHPLHVELDPTVGGQSSLHSNSDNTDPDQLDQAAYSPQELSAIIGLNPPPSTQRLASTCESGYSTPDSKAIKKIIYEVIV